MSGRLTRLGLTTRRSQACAPKDVGDPGPVAVLDVGSDCQPLHHHRTDRHGARLLWGTGCTAAAILTLNVLSRACGSKSNTLTCHTGSPDSLARVCTRFHSTQLGPAVRRGMVEVWALDPKGGMELAAGASLFARFVHGRDTEFADTLEAAVASTQRRQQTLRGQSRFHEPSTDEPLVVLLIDELAALTGYVGDRETKRRIANALGLLLSQGRAVGVVVVAAVQDPRKDTIRPGTCSPLGPRCGSPRPTGQPRPWAWRAGPWGSV